MSIDPLTSLQQWTMVHSLPGHLEGLCIREGKRLAPEHPCSLWGMHKTLTLLTEDTAAASVPSGCILIT